MTTIICAVDGSTDSATALDTASIIARRSDADLLVANVQPIDSVANPGHITSAHADARHMVKLNEDGGRVEFVPLFGHPATELAKLATETQASMIIVGARGKGRARTTFRSRLQRELTEVATVPVVIALNAPYFAPTLNIAHDEPSLGKLRAKRGRRTIRSWADSAPAVRPRPANR